MTEGQRIYEQDFWEKAFLRAVGEGDPTQAEIKSGSEAADSMLEEWRKRWGVAAVNVEQVKSKQGQEPGEAKIEKRRSGNGNWGGGWDKFGEPI